MATIDYEKKIREYLSSSEVDQLYKSMLSNLFPELAESEDERIRKSLIDMLKNDEKCYLKEIAWLEKLGEQKPALEILIKAGLKPYKDGNQWCILVGDNIQEGICGFGDTIEDALYEFLKEVCQTRPKQGEQKHQYKSRPRYVGETELLGEQNHTDKVETKFKAGDWIVRELDNTCYQIKKCILNATTNKYGYDLTNGGYISSQDANFYHLWTIQDAKDGDVLCTYECGKPKIVFILEGVPKKPYVLGYHCFYNIMYPHFKFDSEKGCLAPNEEDVKPATKEQRNLLFQKMKEAGYEWDADKKELKKIEQKPAEWSNEDEELLRDLSDTYFYNDEDYPEETYKQLLKRVLDWMNKRAKSLRPQSKWRPSNEQMEALEHFIVYHNGSTNYAKDLEELRLQFKKLREE